MNQNNSNEVIYRILEGKREAEEAIEQVIAQATNRLDIFDVAVVDRGFNSPARIAQLSHFLRANRSNLIRLTLHEIEGFETLLPRFKQLMQQFSNNIQVMRTTGAARDAQDPLIIADGAHFWHSLHHDHPRSVLTLHSPSDTKALQERFNEIWDSSELAVSAHTTGL